jgi:hypothetical protein
VLWWGLLVGLVGASGRRIGVCDRHPVGRGGNRNFILQSGGQAGVRRGAVDSNSANPCRGNLVDRSRLSKSGLAGALDVERLPCLVRRFLKDHGTHSCVVAGLGDNQGSDERV